MITLKTLPNASEQEVFDQIVSHLRRQKARALNANGCAYHAPDGKKCAAGCLIADDEYSEDMEGKSWTRLAGFAKIPPNHKYLISCLQDVHDSFVPEFWEREFQLVARRCGLQYYEPKEEIQNDPA